MKKMKYSMAFMIQRTKTTVAISSFLFLLSSLIADLNMEGISLPPFSQEPVFSQCSHCGPFCCRSGSA